LTQIYTAGTDAKAVFGDLTASLTDSFRLIAGLRYTNENKTAVGALSPFSTGFAPLSTVNGYSVVTGKPIQINGDTTWTSTNWRAGAQWDVAERSMVYATVATGFHSGGFYFTADNPDYQPEKLTAYTLGSKNRFLDNRLQVNAELFYWKYKNQQLSHVTQDHIGDFVFATENAGGSTIKGAEVSLEYRAPTNTLLTADVQYLDTIFNDFSYLQPFPTSKASKCSSTFTAGKFRVNCTGEPLVNAPKVTVDVGAQQSWLLSNQGSLVGGLRAHHQTGSWTSISYLPVDYQDSFWTEDMGLTYNAPGGKYSWAGFVNNLSNTTVVDNTNHTNVASSQLRAPRTFGVRFTANF
jgi:iron complex outermembrane receptor protein